MCSRAAMIANSGALLFASLYAACLFSLLRHHGCYDFARIDQRGWDFFDIMDVMTLYALTRGAGIF